VVAGATSCAEPPIFHVPKVTLTKYGMLDKSEIKTINKNVWLCLRIGEQNQQSVKV
jgi:hypothetical protein